MERQRDTGQSSDRLPRQQLRTVCVSAWTKTRGQYDVVTAGFLLQVPAESSFSLPLYSFTYDFGEPVEPWWPSGKTPAFRADRLAGLLVKAFASGTKDLGFEFRLQRDFSGSSRTSDLKIGTPLATLPGAWHYGVSAGTGWPGVSILWLGEVESLICNFCLSVAARQIVCADPSLRYTSMLLGR